MPAQFTVNLFESASPHTSGIPDFSDTYLGARFVPSLNGMEG